MIRKYFEAEMRYLHEAGKAYAEVHPETARYLNVDSVTDRDPYVERLFEGFAFLAARVHERLDDEMPVYTEALCSLLYPHLLHPVPSLTMMSFKPKRGLLRGTTVLERGTEVRSGPVGEERTPCLFETTQPVRLQPVSLDDVQLGWSGDGTSSVRLRFSVERGVDPSQLELSPLRLHFLADPAVAATMHLFFTRHVAGVRYEPAGGGTPVVLSGSTWIAPGGFGEEEGLLPYVPNAPLGLRLIQEYLCFRRKFWCVDLLGLERMRLGPENDGFYAEVFFEETYPENHRFGRENVRLFCAPALNLFEADAEPIRVEHHDAEYRVQPSARARRSMAVYDVQEVLGVEDASAVRHTYEPYFAFRHDAPGGAERLYVTRRRPGPLDRPEVYLSLTGTELEDPANLRPETLSLRVRCTNGTLPRERLQEGTIDRLAPHAPQIVDVTNVTQPTLILYPPLERHRDFFWQLISHWSFNHLSVASPEALTGILALYDWSESDANRRRLSGIRGVRWRPSEMPYRGSVVRGAAVTLQIQDGHFDEGELNLFGLVLSRFLSMYATINSFVRLDAERSPSGKRDEWKPSLGDMPTL